MKTVGRRRGGKSEPGDSTAALVTTEETCLTAKSFQRAFIAVKGIFLFLPVCFQVFSALLFFFKILGMGRHNSTDFYRFCFFMTSLAKSRQEPPHLQNLLHWCNSLQLLLRCLGNIKEKHAQLHYRHKSSCPRVPTGACFARDRLDRAQKPLQRWGKRGSGKEHRFFKLFIHFASIWWSDSPISDCMKHRSFGRLKPYFSSDHQMWYVLTSCRTSPGYATTPARSESPTAEAPLSGIAALPARGRAAHLGEGLLFSFILGCCCTALRWANWLIVGGEMVTN